MGWRVLMRVHRVSAAMLQVHVEACWDPIRCNFGWLGLAVYTSAALDRTEPDPDRAAVETRLTDERMSTIIEPLIAATRGGTSIDQEDIAARPRVDIRSGETGRVELP